MQFLTKSRTNWKFIAIIIILAIIVGLGTLSYLQDTKEDFRNVLDVFLRRAPGGEIEIFEAANATEAVNSFALDLFKLYSEEKENIFFSPQSISMAMAMLYEGARGRTAEEIASVFYFPLNDQQRRQEFSSLYQLINRPDEDYRLHTANALWLAKDYPFEQEFLGVIEDYYHGKTELLDFINKPEDSRIIINSWIEEKTEKRIKEAIGPGILSEITRLVITNAIYFKGSWLFEFDKENTRQAAFYTAPGRETKVEMMQLLGEKFNYAETGNAQILELPYDGEGLSMIFILPKDSRMEEVVNDLSRQNLQAWKESMEKREVRAYIPKFKMETSYDMKDDLSSMGMPTVFDYSADLSGITKKENLFVDKVIHKTFLEVDEEGTEAAAVTIIVAPLSVSIDEPPPIPVFRADRPFIFSIQDRESGLILFMGRMADPS